MHLVQATAGQHPEFSVLHEFLHSFSVAAQTDVREVRSGRSGPRHAGCFSFLVKMACCCPWGWQTLRVEPDICRSTAAFTGDFIIFFFIHPYIHYRGGEQQHRSKLIWDKK